MRHLAARTASQQPDEKLLTDTLLHSLSRLLFVSKRCGLVFLTHRPHGQEANRQYEKPSSHFFPLRKTKVPLFLPHSASSGTDQHWKATTVSTRCINTHWKGDLFVFKVLEIFSLLNLMVQVCLNNAETESSVEQQPRMVHLVQLRALFH